ncbi:MAG TPA: hypothetical protein VHZ73_08460 [Vicinamibacterales bacterium]|jgi:hypothetical protein|nr:hypothetical protein [Vicinamibacterales bacterium]
MSKTVSSLRVYIAAPFELQARARAYAAFLDEAGIEVIARWLGTADENSALWADRCLEDVDRVDVLIALNPPGWERTGTGGRHCEVGAALKAGKPVVVIGVASNLFHQHRNVIHIPSGDTLLVTLVDLARMKGWIPQGDDLCQFVARAPRWAELS